jgi:hypothetical protein
MLGDWYTNLYILPTDAQKVWVASYRFSGGAKTVQIYKSTDGGQSFTSMTTNGITGVVNQTSVTIVGVDGAGNVYAHERLDSSNHDDIYKLAPNATSWTNILNDSDQIALLVRSNGDLVAGTKIHGAKMSTDQGSNWTPLTNPPHIGCLVENSAHEIWACTQNYEDTMMSIPSDGYGIMKTTDLTTWTGVLKYENITGPVMCGAGTPQQDTCVGSNWCGLRTQLGITANPVDCSAPTVDAPPDAGSGGPPPKGCCDSGSGSMPPVMMTLLLGILLLRRKRC